MLNGILSVSLREVAIPSLPVGLATAPGSLFDDSCTQREKEVTSAYVELHQLRRRRGSAGKDSEAAWRTRLSAFDALHRNRARDSRDVSPDVAGECNLVGELHLASAF